MGNRLSLVPAPDQAEAPPALTDLSDDDLMLLARGGVRDAFDVLVRRHQRRMLRLASRYVGETVLAADITQNTFVALFRALPSYRPQGKFSAFLYRLLLNQCRMARRSAKLADRTFQASATGEEPDIVQTLQRERQREVELAVAQLSPKLREVVLLRYGAELDYAEIAETLSIPLGTVKRRMFDAMAKLRDVLEEA